MNTSRTFRAVPTQEQTGFEESCIGMLASRSFWIGGAMSAGLWTRLLLAV